MPRITLGETLTDNVAPASGRRRSDQITEISPGIRIDSDSVRLRYHLDYQLRHLIYAQESGRKNTQNYLNAFGTLEAVQKWLFLDVNGVISQQEISPFSFQSASNSNINPNRVETSSFQISPYIRGNLAGTADYEVRYNRSKTHSNSNVVADVDTEEWRGSIKGITSLRPLGWGLEASHRTIDFSSGRNNDEDRFRGLLSYRLVPEFKVSVSAGQETNNFATANRETHDTHGYGFDWLPSERTQVSAFREQRFFGSGHNIRVTHRTPLTSLRFEDTKDVSILPGRFNIVGFGSIFDLMFSQLANTIPDAAERSQYVDRLLQQYGIAPDVVVTRGFTTSRVSVQRRQELAYAIQGPRDILTLSVARSEYERIGNSAPVGANDIFATSANIRQWGYSINLAHRLTPLSNLNVLASQQNNSGFGSTRLQAELRSLLISLSTRLGPRTSASLGLRRTLFDGTTAAPYNENALLASITAMF